MQPEQQERHPVIIDDALRCHPDLLQYMLGIPDSAEWSARPATRAGALLEPDGDAFPRYLGAETPTPEIREKPVSDLDLVASFDLEMADTGPPGDHAGGSVAQDPESESVTGPMRQVALQVGLSPRLVSRSAEVAHHHRILVHQSQVRPVIAQECVRPGGGS